MEFVGFHLYMLDDVLRIERDPPTERSPPPADFRMTGRKNFFDLPWENILCIQDVRIDGARLLITCIRVQGRHNPPRYHPVVYRFELRPASNVTVTYIARILNFRTFGHPNPPPKRFKIIINPKAGRGKAVKTFDKYIRPILSAAGCRYGDPNKPEEKGTVSHVVITTQPKEAIIVAGATDFNDFDAILCIGGDGTVHEVINGLASRSDAREALNKLPVGTIPAGSGNALAMSLFGNTHPTYAAWQAVKVETLRADLMSIVQITDDEQPPPAKWAFMSLSFGWIAHADIHTEAFRGLGDARFTAGIVWQMASRAKYKASLAITGPEWDVRGVWWQQEPQYRADSKTGIIDNYRDAYPNAERMSIIEGQGASMASLVGTKRPRGHWHQRGYDDMLSFYAGKLPWTAKDAMAFPAALSNDGYIDLCILHGNVNFLSMARIFTSFDKGGHVHHNDIMYMKVKSFKLVPGVIYTGPDVEEVQRDIDFADTGNHQTYPRRGDVDTEKFRHKFVLSVDGERLDPAHGIVCEVQQGLARFISDSKLHKYQPTSLLVKTRPSDTSESSSNLSTAQIHRNNFLTAEVALSNSLSLPLEINVAPTADVDNPTKEVDDAIEEIPIDE